MPLARGSATTLSSAAGIAQNPFNPN